MTQHLLLTQIPHPHHHSFLSLPSVIPLTAGNEIIGKEIIGNELIDTQVIGKEVIGTELITQEIVTQELLPYFSTAASSTELIPLGSKSDCYLIQPDQNSSDYCYLVFHGRIYLVRFYNRAGRKVSLHGDELLAVIKELSEAWGDDSKILTLSQNRSLFKTRRVIIMIILFKRNELTDSVKSLKGPANELSSSEEMLMLEMSRELELLEMNSSDLNSKISNPLRLNWKPLELEAPAPLLAIEYAPACPETQKVEQAAEFKWIDKFHLQIQLMLLRTLENPSISRPLNQHRGIEDQVLSKTGLTDNSAPYSQRINNSENCLALIPYDEAARVQVPVSLKVKTDRVAKARSSYSSELKFDLYSYLKNVAFPKIFSLNTTLKVPNLNAESLSFVSNVVEALSAPMPPSQAPQVHFHLYRSLSERANNRLNETISKNAQTKASLLFRPYIQHQSRHSRMENFWVNKLQDLTQAASEIKDRALVCYYQDQFQTPKNTNINNTTCTLPPIVQKYFQNLPLLTYVPSTDFHVNTTQPNSVVSESTKNTTTPTITTTTATTAIALWTPTLIPTNLSVDTDNHQQEEQEDNDEEERFEVDSVDTTFSPDENMPGDELSFDESEKDSEEIESENNEVFEDASPEYYQAEIQKQLVDELEFHDEEEENIQKELSQEGSPEMNNYSNDHEYEFCIADNISSQFEILE